MWIEPTCYNSSGKYVDVHRSQYVIGCDIGYGTGTTPTCFTVFDCNKGEKVAAYVNKWHDPKTMAPYAVALARMFKDKRGNPAKLCWEVPGPGNIFGQWIVEELNFRNIFWNIVDAFTGEKKQSDKPGWFATSQNKLKMHNNYLIALKSGEFVNWDELALKETLNYVHYKGTIEHPAAKKADDPSAEGSNHGDRVVADGLAWLCAKDFITKIERQPEEEIILPNSIAGRMRQRQFLPSGSIWENA